MDEQQRRVGIYARVSTKDQTAENQLRDLREYCRIRNWTVVAEHVDTGLSGSLRERPALKVVMDKASKRKFDVLLVWRYDRFARSLSHLVSSLEELRQRGIDFVSYQESVDTSTSQGRLIFGIMASLAEFERELIRERVRAGIARAKADGTDFGRPNLPDATIQQIIALKGQRSQREIARMVGVGKGSVYRVLSGAPQKPDANVGLFPEEVAVGF
jgi:DNA invertase Pin-like site-specific DNA recombinase